MKFGFSILLKTVNEYEVCIKYKFHFKKNSHWISLIISKMGHCTWKRCMIQNIKVKVTSSHAYLGTKGRWRYGYYPLASQD